MIQKTDKSLKKKPFTIRGNICENITVFLTSEDKWQFREAQFEIEGAKRAVKRQRLCKGSDDIRGEI